jgi:hypothetical protein
MKRYKEPAPEADYRLQVGRSGKILFGLVIKLN